MWSRPKYQGQSGKAWTFDAKAMRSMSRLDITHKFQISLFFNTIFVSSHMYPENPEGTQVIVSSMNMGYISDIARNRTHNLFHPKREPIPLDHIAICHTSLHNFITGKLSFLSFDNNLPLIKAYSYSRTIIDLISD